MRCFNKCAILLIAVLAMVSCVDKLDAEFGNSRIYFSNTSAGYVLKDSASLSDLALRPDTTLNFVGLYRSGIVENYEAITIKVEIDSAYLAAQIAAAQTALPSEMTDIMIKYKNAKAIGAHFCSIPTTVVIPTGQRKVTLPVTVRKAIISLYDNAYFNYTNADFLNSAIVKNKMLVIPFKITTVSPTYPVLEKQMRCYVEIVKQIDFAN